LTVMTDLSIYASLLANFIEVLVVTFGEITTLHD